MGTRDVVGNPRLFWLVAEVQHAIEAGVFHPNLGWQCAARHRPDGYRIGVNVGEAAEQTVGHAHLHVILRCRGDVAGPRGGIRWMIPGRARYWEGK